MNTYNKLQSGTFLALPGLKGAFKGMKDKKLSKKYLERIQTLGAKTSSRTCLGTAASTFIITIQPSPMAVVPFSSHLK